LVIENTCIGCHMAATPGNDDDGNPLPGRDEVGEHTFAMTSPEGIENLEACITCHADVETFDFAASDDYDGDGAVEGVEEEVAGLRELVEAAIVEKGVVVLDHHPYFEMPEDADENLFGATWNLELSGSSGAAFHNFKYIVSLLQLSYEKVTGEPVPGAVILQ
jgi:hypothetical protein